jgi:hypothetical protein
VARKPRDEQDTDTQAQPQAEEKPYPPTPYQPGDERVRLKHAGLLREQEG